MPRVIAHRPYWPHCPRPIRSARHPTINLLTTMGRAWPQLRHKIRSRRRLPAICCDRVSWQRPRSSSSKSQDLPQFLRVNRLFCAVHQLKTYFPSFVIWTFFLLFLINDRLLKFLDVDIGPKLPLRSPRRIYGRIWARGRGQACSTMHRQEEAV